MADSRLKGADVRYGGRTFKFEVFVNTDASRGEIKERLLAVQVVARGPREDMVICALGEVPAAQAEEFWLKVISGAREAAGEKSS